jgi:hypothetical protein
VVSSSRRKSSVKEMISAVGGFIIFQKLFVADGAVSYSSEKLIFSPSSAIDTVEIPLSISIEQLVSLRIP